MAQYHKHTQKEQGMLKKIAAPLISGLIFLGTINTAFSASGDFFSVREDCYVQEAYQIHLCLDAAGPLTCQMFTVHATMLTINTKVPYQAYGNAGIKALSSLYKPANCTPNQNGYCAFSVSDTLSHTIVMDSGPGFFHVC